MALQKQEIPINFVTGINQFLDEKMQQPPGLIALTNGQFLHGNTIGQRYGYAGLGGTAAYPIRRLIDAGGEIMAFTSPGAAQSYQSMQAYNPDADVFASKNNGTPQYNDCVSRTNDVVAGYAGLADGTTGERNYDCATTADGKVTLYAWYRDNLGGNNVVYAVRDRATGAIISTMKQVASAPTATDTPRCIAIGNTIIIGLIDRSGGGAVLRLYSYGYVTNSLIVGSTITMFAGSELWDITPDLGSQAAVIAQTAVGSTTIAHVSTLAAISGSVVHAIVGSALGRISPAATKFRIFALSGGAVLTALLVDRVTLAALGASYTVVAAGVTGLTAVESSATTFDLVTQADSGGAYSQYVAKYYNCTDNALPTLAATLVNSIILSQVFLRGGNPYLLVRPHLGDSQSIYCVQIFRSGVSTSTPVFLPVAKMLEDLAGAKFTLSATRPRPANIDLLSSGHAITVTSKLQAIADTVTNFYAQVGIDLAFPVSAYDWAGQLSNTNEFPITYQSGGFLTAFDGVSLFEASALEYSTILGVQVSAAGNLTTGQYQYCIVFEWRDVHGNIYESRPSRITTATVATPAGSTALQCLPLRHTTIRDETGRLPVKVSLYRTTVNGSIFYLASAPSGTTANSPGANNIGFSDNLSDADLESRKQLYTTGGVFENATPDSPSIIYRGAGRLFVDDCDDTGLVRYSKSIVVGDAIAFSDFGEFRVPSSDGPITAISAIDDRPIIFKRDRIYSPDGTPLDDAGTSGGYVARRLPLDVGCVAQHCVAEIPSGLVFQSPKGIYLLARDLSVQFIGAPLLDDGTKPILSMDIVLDQSHLRILHDDDTVSVYDWRFNAWFTYNNILASDAVVSKGRYYWSYNDPDSVFALCWGETVGAFADTQNLGGDSAIPMRIETPWLSFAGVEGFQRIYKILFLGNLVSTFDFEVGVDYDYNLSDTDTHSIGATIAGSHGTLFPELRPSKQKCQSIKLSINNVGGSGSEQFSLNNMTLVVGVKAGGARNKAARRF